jgi:hypothetical protein
MQRVRQPYSFPWYYLLFRHILQSRQEVLRQVVRKGHMEQNQQTLELFMAIYVSMYRQHIRLYTLTADVA